MSKKMLFTLTLACVTACGVSTASAAECVKRGGCWLFGQTSAMSLTSPGGPCTWNLRPSGKTTVTGIKVNSPPANGSLSTAASSATYVPKAGFKGRDTFAVVVSGSANGNPGAANVNVTIDVP